MFPGSGVPSSAGPLLRFTIFLINAFPVSLVTYPALCFLLTHDDSLILGGDDLLCPPVTVTHGSLCPFVSCGLGCPMPSRLALDDAIRHKPLNMSSRFSPRVAGENDFLQTVINKVIAAKEVNHKGQGVYLCCFCLWVCEESGLGCSCWNLWDWVMLLSTGWVALQAVSWITFVGSWEPASQVSAEEGRSGMWLQLSE